MYLFFLKKFSLVYFSLFLSCLLVFCWLVSLARLFVVQCKRFLQTRTSLILSAVDMAITLEHRIGKSRKDKVKKMGRRSDSKNEWNWIGKEGRTDPKKLEGLSRKMRRTDSKHGRPESKQGRYDSKTRQVWLEKRRSCWHLTVIVIMISSAQVI